MFIVISAVLVYTFVFLMFYRILETPCINTIVQNKHKSSRRYHPKPLDPLPSVPICSAVWLITCLDPLCQKRSLLRKWSWKRHLPKMKTGCLSMYKVHAHQVWNDTCTCSQFCMRVLITSLPPSLVFFTLRRFTCFCKFFNCLVSSMNLSVRL